MTVRLPRPMRVLLHVLLMTLASTTSAKEAVILLHGMVRTDKSMAKMAAALEKEGFIVLNVDYPSRETTVEPLATKVIPAALADPKLKDATRIHFVAHSLGGILIRHYFKTNRHDRLGRVVMLGPPNQGSEVVDKIGDWRTFTAINGPVGRQLGTGPDSVPNQLGPVDFELGVIAGDRSINWINSLGMIPGPDDGKVSVARTKVAGMKAHRVLHVTHPYLMKNARAIRETVHFLRHGQFIP
jgi:triacylglycerol lipase